MADKRKAKQIAKKLPLSGRQKELALTVLIRNETAYKAVSDQISRTTFETLGNSGYAALWAAVTDFYKRFNKLPTRETLAAEFESRLELTEDLKPEDFNELSEFMEYAFDVPEAELEADVALSYVSQMLDEQIQKDMLDELCGGVVVDLPMLLQQKKEVSEAVKSLTNGLLDEPFPENPEDIKPLIIEPTGVSFLDLFMNGGMARKEVNGFCGPYGSCKTTLGVMLAVERARHMLSAWRLAGSVGKPQRVYFVSYEEEKEQLQPRFISYAASIHRRSLEGNDYRDKLSRTDMRNVKDYERSLFKNQIANEIYEGEYDRMKYAMQELNQNLRIVDFSGYDESLRDAASRMVEGIVETIKRDQEKSGNPGVALVVVDYAGAAAERAITTRNLDRKDTRHLVGRFPLNLKTGLAVPFDCQVWCLHQLGTEANSREAGVAPKSTDAAEARNFFENVNFGFMVGKPTTEGMTVLTCGKQRRAERKEDIVIKIEGALSRVQDASKHYMINQRTIVSRADAGRIAFDEDMDRPATKVKKDSLFKDIDRDIGI